MVKKLILAVLVGLTLSAATAEAGIRFNIGIGLPIFAPCYPRPVYVAPAPVYVVPASVYVQPAPTPAYAQPAAAPIYAQPAATPAYGQPAYAPPPR